MEGARRDRDACGQGRHEHGQEAPEAGPASYRVSRSGSRAVRLILSQNGERVGESR